MLYIYTYIIRKKPVVLIFKFSVSNELFLFSHRCRHILSTVIIRLPTFGSKDTLYDLNITIHLEREKTQVDGHKQIGEATTAGKFILST